MISFALDFILIFITSAFILVDANREDQYSQLCQGLFLYLTYVKYVKRRD